MSVGGHQLRLKVEVSVVVELRRHSRAAHLTPVGHAHPDLGRGWCSQADTNANQNEKSRCFHRSLPQNH